MSKEQIDVIPNIMENFKDIREESIGLCEFCAKKIGNSKWQKKHQHINVGQEPVRRFFCSQQCKLNWIFKSS
jgi:hypothetical protein